jgi:hypothetical protein
VYILCTLFAPFALIILQLLVKKIVPSASIINHLDFIMEVESYYQIMADLKFGMTHLCT